MKTDGWVYFLSYDGLTDPLGQSQILPYMEGLAKRGFKLMIFSCEKKNRFGLFGSEIQTRLKKAGIEWEFIYYTKKPPILSTLYDLFRLKGRINRKLKSHPPQIIHGRSVLPSLIGFRISVKTGARFLFDMRGFWADEKADAGYWNLKNPIYRRVYSFFRKKELLFFKESHALVSLTEMGVKRIAKECPSHAEATVIPCSLDVSGFKKDFSEEREKLRLEWGFNSGNKILVYAGSLGGRYRLSEMFLFFSKWHAKEPEARFVFLSNSPEKLIRETASALNVSSDLYRIRTVVFSEMPRNLSACDFGIFFYHPGNSGEGVSPTKFGEYLAAGLPVIANPDLGDVEDIVKRTGCGILVNPDSLESMNDAVAKMEREKFRDRDYFLKVAAEEFGMEKALDKYESVYQKLM